MKNILIYANTYMQVINAIQIRLKLYPDDNVDLIISDHSVGAETVARNLQNEKQLFGRVKYVHTYFIEFEQNVFKDIMDVFYINMMPSRKCRSFFWDSMIYDEIIYYNVGILLYALLDTVYKKKPLLRWLKPCLTRIVKL